MQCLVEGLRTSCLANASTSEGLAYVSNCSNKALADRGDLFIIASAIAFQTNGSAPDRDKGGEAAFTLSVHLSQRGTSPSQARHHRFEGVRIQTRCMNMKLIVGLSVLIQVSETVC